MCDPDQLDPQLVKQLSAPGESQATPVQREQVGKLAITLDDQTKWSYPSFQKRFLQPERSENQVLSSRYIWEIVRPGHFVTRSQNPEYFVEPEVSPSNKNEEVNKK